MATIEAKSPYQHRSSTFPCAWKKRSTTERTEATEKNRSTVLRELCDLCAGASFHFSTMASLRAWDEESRPCGSSFLLISLNLSSFGYIAAKVCAVITASFAR